MRKIRDVLTCLYKDHLSIRKAAQYTGVSRHAVSDYQSRFKTSTLTWPLPSDLDDVQLEAILFPKKPSYQGVPYGGIDYSSTHAELKKKGATLIGLYEEMLEKQSNTIPVGYTQFTRGYRQYVKQLRISLRQTYQFGQIAFVDYAGHTISIIDPGTGETRTAQIFVGVLGASYYTFAEATWSQKLQDWVGSHTRMFQFFGGVPATVVHDNLRAAVTKANRLSPVINETYLAMCRHYETHPFAARAYKPKDKARGEAAVLLVERWILFRLRKHKFFSLAEANKCIRELLGRLNNKSFQKLNGSRFSQWMENEKLALQSLPVEQYEFAEWGKVRAGTDYYVNVDGHNYSVPNQYRSHECEYRLSSTVLELYYKRKLIVAHQRSDVKGGTTTEKSHRPPAHNAIAIWDPQAALSWARGIGPSTEKLFSIKLPKLNNHLFGYRFVNSIKKLANTFGTKRLEEVCTYAIENGVHGSGELRNILAKNLDRLFAASQAGTVPESTDIHKTSDHENIRGADYYNQILKDKEQG